MPLISYWIGTSSSSLSLLKVLNMCFVLNELLNCYLRKRISQRKEGRGKLESNFIVCYLFQICSFLLLKLEIYLHIYRREISVLHRLTQCPTAKIADPGHFMLISLILRSSSFYSILLLFTEKYRKVSKEGYRKYSLCILLSVAFLKEDKLQFVRNSMKNSNCNKQSDLCRKHLM